MNSTEIKYITKACSITVKILNQVIKELKKHSFKTEIDIEKFLKQKTEENKCRFAFEPVIAMGKNAAEIHHESTRSKLKKGFLVIDFGVRYNGYCGDCTRTFYLYGKPSKEEERIYNLILLAQETALIHAQPGVYAADVDLIVRNILKEYPIKFVHGSGHGIGKRIHKLPSLEPGSKSILKENQAITIEPGLYFKNKLGIRIEDTIIVKQNPIILTKLSKKLTIIK
ncbi:M24 family metallopeptidase [Candidatus Woesearchaeota archaeon]|nr:M24 family metallopeptidase [Candidatus Woesearchaeota archaeon]